MSNFLAMLCRKPGSGGNPSERHAIFDGTDLAELLLELDSADRVTKTVLSGPSVDMVMAEETISYAANGTATFELSWPMGDHQGTANAILKAGAVAYQPLRTAFGEKIANTGTESDSAFGFQGQLDQSKTEFSNFRARQLQTNAGRFISQDPIRFASGQTNFYQFVGNHPQMGTDPSGLQEPEVGSTVRESSTKVKFPLSVIKIRGGAATAQSAAVAIKNKPAGARGASPVTVGAAIGYLQVMADWDHEREVKSAESSSAIQENVASMLIEGIESGAITLEQADSIAKTYNNYAKWAGHQYRGYYHASIGYRLAAEVNSGNISLFSQAVLADQLTGSWFLPSAEKINNSIQQAAATDAKKMAALKLSASEEALLAQAIAISAEEFTNPKRLWYHGTDYTGGKSIDRLGLNRKSLEQFDPVEGKDNRGLYVTDSRSFAESWAHKMTARRKQSQPGFLIIFQEQDIKDHWVGGNDGMIIPYEAFNKIPRSKFKVEQLKE